MAWFQVLLKVQESDCAWFEALLWDAGASAVTMEGEAGTLFGSDPTDVVGRWDKTKMIGLFEDPTRIADIVWFLRSRSGSRFPTFQVEELLDQDWVRVGVKDLQPMRFGERLWVCPLDSRPPVPEAVWFHLDPGLGFGTGTHPTTALCLRWLDGHVLTGMAVVDYGCGSGILAVAAAKLGARRVWAVDCDPDALEATRVNVEKNEVSSIVNLCLPELLPDLQADLLMANILSGPLVVLAPIFAKQVRPGGSMVLSGILEDQCDDVIQAYDRWFQWDPVTHCIRSDGWVRLEGRRADNPV